jgi:hypothetical protein
MSKGTETIIHSHKPLQFLPGHFTGEVLLNGEAKLERSESIQKLIDEAFIDLDVDLPPPDKCVGIVDDGKEYPLFHMGDFSLLTGKAKSKKTFAVLMFLAAAVLGQTIYNKIRGFLSGDKNLVVLFDTEQSRYKTSQIAKKICRLIGYTPKNFKVFNLRKYKPEQRIDIIGQFLYQHAERIGYVVIDGVRDLGYDINDSIEATVIATKLLTWTQELNCHITVVLHQNKGNENARGHLGTELINKAQTTLSAAKDKNNPNVTNISPEECREIDFPGFSFTVNEDGLPYLVDAPEEVQNERQALTAFDVEPEVHKQILKKAFAQNSQPKNAQLVQEIKVAAQGIFGKFGDNKAKDFLTYYISTMGWVQKVGKDRAPNTYYLWVGNSVS